MATVYTGYGPDGKRRRVKLSAKTKTEAKLKLRAMLRDVDTGNHVAPPKYTVEAAVEAWLEHASSVGNPRPSPTERHWLGLT